MFNYVIKIYEVMCLNYGALLFAADVFAVVNNAYEL